MNNGKIQIIPAVDILGGRCVRLFKGRYDEDTVYYESPAEAALLWEKEGAEFLHLVDLDGARKGSPANLAAVAEINSRLGIPTELGGGIRTPADAEAAFEAGVSRIILGTVACRNPALAAGMMDAFGPEKIVIGIDARNGMASVAGWLQDTSVKALDLAAKFADTGAKRFIYTDIDTDGTLSGPNLDAVSEFCAKIPDCAVIASGGISSPENIRQLSGLDRGNLVAAIVGKALYDGRTTLAELKTAGSSR